MVVKILQAKSHNKCAVTLINLAGGSKYNIYNMTHESYFDLVGMNSVDMNNI